MRQILRQIVAVLAFVGITMSIAPSTFAATYNDLSAANKLATAGIVVDHSASPAQYRLADNVLRQEAIGVAGKVSGVIPNTPVSSYTCMNKFSDISEAWVCRAAELGVQAGLVNGNNAKFRPRDNVSRYESLLWAIKSNGISISDTSVSGVVARAVEVGIISNASAFNATVAATRGEVFRYNAYAMDYKAANSNGNGNNDILCLLDPSFCGNNGGTVVNGNVTVGTSAANPGVMTIATGTAHNTVLAFNVSNSSSAAANVTGLRLTKAGFYSTTAVSGIEVFDANGVRHGNVVTTLGSNGVAIMTFPTEPIMVAAGQTVTIFVKANISSANLCNGNTTTCTGTVGFNVNSASDITISGGTVGGSFPIVGSLHNVVSGAGTIATVTLDEMAVNAGGATYNADPVASQEIAKFQVRETSSNEDIVLTGLTLWNNGNASANDYKDVQLVDQTGAVVATAQPMGQVVKFVLATPYTITKGQTKNFTVRATIVNGASRTIQFTVYNDYDLYVRGVSTGATLLATAGTTDTSFPIGDTSASYNKVTIGSGSLIFNRSVDSSSTAVTPGATDVVLAKYTAKPVGEDMELRTVSFGIDQDAGSVALTGTVFVKVNGAVVYSAAANTTNFPIAGTVASRTLSSYPILTAGVENTIEVVASVSSSATATDAYSVTNFDVTSVKRLISNDITDPSVSPQSGFTRSVKAAAVTVTTLATPVAGSIVPGTNGVKLASFEFNASSSGEDVRVTAITVTDTLSSGSAYTAISNLVMKDASGAQITTSSSTATNAATVTFTFTNPIVVSRSATTVINLFGDVVSGATAGVSHTFKIASASNVTATGKDTGNSISAPTVAGSGQAMSLVSGGSLSVSTDSGAGKTPSLAQVVPINTVDEVYLAARLSSQFEAQKITHLTLKATGTSLVQNNIKNIRLYAQSGTGPLLGSTAAFASTNQFSSCSSNVCEYTWTATDNLLPATIDPSSPITIFVKADLQGENTAMLGNDFYFSIAQVAQVSTDTLTGTAGTASVVINGTTVSVANTGTLSTTVTALKNAVNASSVADVVTATESGGTAVIVTSDVEGLPFTMTGASAGGTTDSIVATTANAGVAVKGAISNTYLLAASTSGSAANATAKTYIVPFKVTVTGETPTNGSVTNSSIGAGTQLARFKITNNGSAQVTLTHAKFTDSGSHTGTAARYTVYASSENSNDYTANTLETSSTDSVDFGSLASTVTLNGGSSRYITVAITTNTGVIQGDTFSYSVASLGDLKFSAAESALLYDGDQDNAQTSTISSLFVDGKPALGTIQKQ